jgi:hypothetical protein
MPWRRVGEWRYSSTYLDLGTRWRWVISFTSLPLYPRGKSCRYPLVGAHPASYPTSTGGPFSRGKRVGTWSWDTTGILITAVSVASRRATDLTAGVWFSAGARCFSSPQRPDRFWGPRSLLSQWVPGALPPGVITFASYNFFYNFIMNSSSSFIS